MARQQTKIPQRVSKVLLMRRSRYQRDHHRSRRDISPKDRLPNHPAISFGECHPAADSAVRLAGR
jgi:hypothetical protein